MNVTAGDVRMTQGNDLWVMRYLLHKGKHFCLQQNYVHGFTQATPSFSGDVQEGLIVGLQDTDEERAASKA